MNSDLTDLRLFALGATRSFGARVAEALGISPSLHEEREFADGEHKTRPLVDVRGADVFVLHSLHSDREESVNDKLCRLLFFLGACRDSGAARVTAVTPYLCYGRKDRKTKARDPVTTRYVAQLFEAIGTDAVLTMDAHNLSAYQNAFGHGCEHLEARTLFRDHFADLLASEQIAVISPDVGGVKRAEAFRKILARRLDRPVASGFMQKERSRGVVSGETLVGDVRDRSVIFLDDMIGTGTTIARAASACRTAGAARCYAAATHGLFLEGAADVVQDPVLDGIVVTDTIPPFRLPDALVAEKVTVIESFGLFAETIRRLHSAGSLVELLEQE